MLRLVKIRDVTSIARTMLRQKRLVPIAAVLLLATDCTYLKAQTIYIGESYNTIEAYSANGTDLGVFASGNPQVEEPEGLAISGSGQLFESDFNNFSIEEFNSSGAATTFANSTTGLNDPWGLVFDQSGNLYVANSGLQSILKYTPDGSVSTLVSRTIFNAPEAMAIDSSGN